MPLQMFHCVSLVKSLPGIFASDRLLCSLCALLLFVSGSTWAESPKTAEAQEPTCLSLFAKLPRRGLLDPYLLFLLPAKTVNERNQKENQGPRFGYRAQSYLVFFRKKHLRPEILHSKGSEQQANEQLSSREMLVTDPLYKAITSRADRLREKLRSAKHQRQAIATPGAAQDEFEKLLLLYDLVEKIEDRISYRPLVNSSEKYSKQWARVYVDHDLSPQEKASKSSHPYEEDLTGWFPYSTHPVGKIRRDLNSVGYLQVIDLKADRPKWTPDSFQEVEIGFESGIDPRHFVEGTSSVYLQKIYFDGKYLRPNEQNKRIWKPNLDFYQSIFDYALDNPDISDELLYQKVLEEYRRTRLP